MGDDWEGFYNEFDFSRKLLPANDMVIHEVKEAIQMMSSIPFIFRLPTLETAIA